MRRLRRNSAARSSGLVILIVYSEHYNRHECSCNNEFIQSTQHIQNLNKIFIMLSSTPVPQFEFQNFLARVSIVCRLFFMIVCSVPPARSHLFFKRDRDLQQPNAYWKPERDSAVYFTGVIQHLFQIRRGKLILHRFCFNPIIYTTDYYYCL